MSNETLEQKNDTPEMPKRVVRILDHRMLGNETRRAGRSALVQIERERREALGQSGRVEEDALRSVQASVTPSMWEYKQKTRADGKLSPLPGYEDSYPSFSFPRTVKGDLDNLSADNPIRHMQSRYLAFAVGLTPDGQFAQDEDGHTDVFMIGQDYRLQTTDEVIKFDRTFIDGLPVADLNVLEKVAQAMIAESQAGVLDSVTGGYI